MTTAKAPLSPEKRLERTLSRLSLDHTWQALLCVPKSYLDCRIAHARCISSNATAAYRLRFTGRMVTTTVHGEAFQGFDWKMRPKRVDMEFEDSTGAQVDIRLFGDYSAWVAIAPEAEIAVAGTPQQYGPALSLKNPILIPAGTVGTVWTQYRGIPGRISTESVTELIKAALSIDGAARMCAEHILRSTPEIAESEILARTKADSFESLENLILCMHRPASPEDGLAAIEAAGRIGALTIRLEACRRNTRASCDTAPLRISIEDVHRVAKTQRETLSAEQVSASEEITNALGSTTPLMGLLLGDVGTGKTLVYLLPLIAAHLAGSRCAIIAPTQILADQIAQEIEKRFAEHGACIERVPSGGKILDPEAILVGTYGLNTVAKKAKYTPNLLVVDEQHKMAVATRETMLGPQTHLIEVSATPVPRSLASSKFGGMRVFSLTKAPVEKRITSHLIDVSQRPVFSRLLREAIARKEKAAIIYPLVSSEDPPLECDDEVATEIGPRKTSVQSVASAAKTLEKHFPGKVCLLHGQLSDKEKRDTIARIRANETPLIVGSTVMETGIDIPSISVMVVRDASSFGAAQLHQLRGRLVRNGGEGHFVMMVENLSDLAPQTLARLTSIKEESNGFKVAQADMLLRGFGSFDGENQSGGTNSVFRLLRMRTRDFLAIDQHPSAR